jgi:hypothetical protein
MGAKTSQEMLKARELIEKGATAYRAAKDCGVTVSAITRSGWYHEFKARKDAEDATKGHEPTPMERARKLVTVDGKTAYEASKLTGVAQSSISRAAWYRAHIDKLVDSFKPRGASKCAK